MPDPRSRRPDISIAVVGGGVVGLAAAEALLRRGRSRNALRERAPARRPPRRDGDRGFGLRPFLPRRALVRRRDQGLDRETGPEGEARLVRGRKRVLCPRPDRTVGHERRLSTLPLPVSAGQAPPGAGDPDRGRNPRPVGSGLGLGRALASAPLRRRRHPQHLDAASSRQARKRRPPVLGRLHLVQHPAASLRPEGSLGAGKLGRLVGRYPGPGNGRRGKPSVARCRHENGLSRSADRAAPGRRRPVGNRGWSRFV